MGYYTNILLRKNSVYDRPSCTLFRFRVVIMTTLDHVVEEECRRILLEEEEEGRGSEEGGGGIHFMFSCLRLKWLVW